MSNDDPGHRTSPIEDADRGRVQILGRQGGQKVAEEEETADRKHQDRHSTLCLRIEAVALVIVAVGIVVAWLTLVAIRDSVDAMDAQIEADRNALWLDQRPWLGVSTAEVLGGFELGGKPTIRLNIVNSGKTPALNVKLFERVSLSYTVDENEIREWEPPAEFFPSIHYRSDVAFPDVTVHQDISWELPLDEDTFGRYRNSQVDVTVWSRIEYCGPDQSFHWTETGLSKTFSQDEILFRRSSASDHPRSLLSHTLRRARVGFRRQAA